MTWAGSYRATPTVATWGGNHTSMTIAATTGVAAGDLVLLWATGGVLVNTPSGFTSAGDGRLFWKVATSSESTYQAIFSGGANTAGLLILATLNGSSGTPSIDAVGGDTAPGSASTNPYAAGLTVAAANELLIFFCKDSDTDRK